MNPGSLLSQFANFFFLASGLFNDLLIIRLCLVFAYGFLFIIALMGLPGWGDSPLWTGRMAIDILVWSILNIVVVHGSGVIRMYYDERSINFPTKESEMLWRFFYRHSGLSKAQFQALVLKLQLERSHHLRALSVLRLRAGLRVAESCRRIGGGPR